MKANSSNPSPLKSPPAPPTGAVVARDHGGEGAVTIAVQHGAAIQRHVQRVPPPNPPAHQGDTLVYVWG